MTLPIVLLPGMDGTGDLFAELVRSAPPSFRPSVLPLPESGSYADLFDAVAAQLPEGEQLSICAASFFVRMR